MSTLKDLILARLTERLIPGDNIGGGTPLGVTIDIISEHFERLMFGRCLHVAEKGEQYTCCLRCARALPEPQQDNPVDPAAQKAMAAANEALASLEKSHQLCRELEEHVKKLDANWEELHNAALGSIRLALGMPEATVPEMAVAIVNARQELPYLLHDAWTAGYENPGPNPHPKRPDSPPLGVYTDDVYYVIAHSAEDASAIVASEDLSDDWRPRERLAPDCRISIRVWKAGDKAGDVAPQWLLDSHCESLNLTAAQWIARRGRGFLCSMES